MFIKKNDWDDYCSVSCWSQAQYQEEKIGLTADVFELPLLINLYGGPGTGKSTTAAGVFSLLKLHGVNAELVPEFAKDLTWEGRTKTLLNQCYIWGKQHNRLFRLVDSVDVIVTDSPLLLSIMYSRLCGHAGNQFISAVLESYHQFNNVDIVLDRVKEYNPSGRSQTEIEAKSLDSKIISVLDEFNIKYYTDIPGNYDGINIITEEILRVFQKKMIFSLKEEKTA